MISRGRIALGFLITLFILSALLLAALIAIMMTSSDLIVDESSDAPTPMGAVVHDKRFEKVVEVFRSNLDAGLERAGAAFAVYYKGKPAVHVWGGYAAIKEQRVPEKAVDQVKMLSGTPWDAQTMTVMFSTTKCLSALALAHVLQSSSLSYSSLVVDVWPEYGQHGKERTTIGDVALHSAGVPYGPRPLTPDDVQRPEVLAKYFEDSKPVWEPGSASGYHALTIGLLIDQIVRRIDDKGRGVWEILDDDLLRPHGIVDVSMGLREESDNARVATLSGPDRYDIEREELRNPESLRLYNLGNNTYNDRLNEVFSWITPTAEDYNRLSNRLLSMPSNLGIANAEALSHALSIVASGSFLNEKTLGMLSKPVLEHEMDIINGYEESKGYGFQYTKSPKGAWIFGHSGLGGQNVRIDVEEGLAIAYLCNGMKIADADIVEPWKRLVDEVYRSLP